MKSLQKGFTVIEALMIPMLLIAVAAVVGWIMNIFWVIKHIDDTITGIFILHAVGIVVPPLGAIMGYL